MPGKNADQPFPSGRVSRLTADRVRSIPAAFSRPIRSRLTALAVASIFVLPAPSAMAQGLLNLLTGGTSGVYYPLGVAIGKIFSDTVGFALAAVVVLWQWRQRSHGTVAPA